MIITVNSIEELENAASQILSYLDKHQLKFVAIKGEMGAGKTTLVNEILKLMDGEEAGSSPTFSIWMGGGVIAVPIRRQYFPRFHEG